MKSVEGGVLDTSLARISEKTEGSLTSNATNTTDWSDNSHWFNKVEVMTYFSESFGGMVGARAG